MTKLSTGVEVLPGLHSS